VIAQQVGLYGSTGPVQPEWFPAADKLQHALGFALPMFSVLMTLDEYAARSGRTLRPAWFAVVGGLFAVNAVVSELYQARPSSGRNGDAFDTLADLTGIAVGGLAYVVVRRRRATVRSAVQDGA